MLILKGTFSPLIFLIVCFKIFLKLIFIFSSNPKLAASFNVCQAPTVLIFKDSKVEAEIVGTVPAQVISDYLNKNFGEPFQ